MDRVAVEEQKAKQGGSTSSAVSLMKTLASDMPKWASGKLGSPRANPNYNPSAPTTAKNNPFIYAANGTAAMNYNTAMTNAMSAVKQLPPAQQAAAAQAAQAIVNANFPENGQNGRQFTGQSAVVAAASFAQQKLKQGESAQKALADMTAWGYVDQATARAAIQKVYSGGTRVKVKSTGPLGVQAVGIK